jgi:hypothetical protein
MLETRLTAFGRSFLCNQPAIGQTDRTSSPRPILGTRRSRILNLSDAADLFAESGLRLIGAAYCLETIRIQTASIS